MSERELLALESIECRLGVIEAQNRAIYAQNRIIMSAISVKIYLTNPYIAL